MPDSDDDVTPTEPATPKVDEAASLSSGKPTPTT